MQVSAVLFLVMGLSLTWPPAVQSRKELVDRVRDTVDRMLQRLAQGYVEELKNDITDWMPKDIGLLGLEVEEDEYLCGTDGKTQLSIEYVGTDADRVRLQDEKINVIVKFQANHLQMAYKVHGENVPHSSRDSNISFIFGKNLLKLSLEIPNFTKNPISPLCLVTVKNFDVVQMELLKVRSNLPEVQKVVEEFVDSHKSELMNVLRVAVIRAMYDMLRVKNNWICQTEIFREFSEMIKDFEPTKQFVQYCSGGL